MAAPVVQQPAIFVKERHPLRQHIPTLGPPLVRRVVQDVPGLIIVGTVQAKLELPLAIYEELSAFKLYMLDIGLLGAMVNTEASQVLIDDSVFTEYKGGVTEQFIYQQIKCELNTPTYYHTTDDSRLEVDFIVQYKGKMLPIEVKAGRNVRANSLSMLLAKTPDMRAVRFSMLPYKQQSQLTNIPLYAAPIME
ncbi:MAG: DUF4143 domain-containing protein [Fibrobacter sp.]|nr:DUF4143 domain-containing protein [Fibrobacter sp.]